MAASCPSTGSPIIFNPSFPYRFVHTVDRGFYLTTAFAVLGVAAWYLKRGAPSPEARAMMRDGARLLIAILVPLQIVVGDLHGAQHARASAGEACRDGGPWETQAGAPRVLFALPDEAAEKQPLEVAIPELGSLYLTHSTGRDGQGARRIPARGSAAGRDRLLRVPDDGRHRPADARDRASGRLWLRWRGRLFTTALRSWRVHRDAPAGFVAVIAGWTDDRSRAPAVGRVRPDCARATRCRRR